MQVIPEALSQVAGDSKRKCTNHTRVAVKIICRSIQSYTDNTRCIVTNCNKAVQVTPEMFIDV
jgi:hypothetical protein